VIDDYSSLKVTNIIRGWHGVIWDTSIHKYELLITQTVNMMILVGFAPSKLFDISMSIPSCGWFILLNNCSGCKVGDIITCIYDASTSEISYEKNGVSLGVDYCTTVIGEDIAPAVGLFHSDDSVLLVTSYYRMKLPKETSLVFRRV
jgi:hypothetical protein